MILGGILYARKKRKKSIPPGFGLGTENHNMKNKDDNSLFDTTTGLFDEEKDEKK